MRHLISTSTALATVALALPLIALTGSPAHAETTFDLCSHPGNLIVGTGSADLLVGTLGDDIILGMGGMLFLGGFALKRRRAQPAMEEPSTEA